jgi:UDP-N-acetylglucosamine 2-epimerase (hydrolysing)
MKKILFLTGTRADFGKLKTLIQTVKDADDFEYLIFATGMHLQQEYGFTVLEIKKSGFKNLKTFENHTSEMTMDLTLAKTIEGLSQYVNEIKPDLLVIHGDRIETLAGAIVGSLNNILVAHIEGGELSGTVDELIRHSVTKLSHIHFVSNKEARRRLVQMGELENSIFTIGSPDMDVMFSANLPTLERVKDYYEIDYEKYAIVMFHPVTTEAESVKKYTEDLVTALLEDDNNYVLIYPNNDMGSSTILQEYKRLAEDSRFRIIPSLRFEYFLQLLKNAEFIIGNSSAGIREAPSYGTPVVNIGTRQNNRSSNSRIINCDYALNEIKLALNEVKNSERSIPENLYGSGNSAQLFLEKLKMADIWELQHQKQFRDLN